MSHVAPSSKEEEHVSTARAGGFPFSHRSQSRAVQSAFSSQSVCHIHFLPCEVTGALNTFKSGEIKTKLN